MWATKQLSDGIDFSHSPTKAQLEHLHAGNILEVKTFT